VSPRLPACRPRIAASAVLPSVLAVLGLGPVGCAPERARDRSATTTPESGDVPPTTELRRLYGLAEAVFVGQVDTVDEGDGGTIYRVRPVEVIKAPPDAMSASATHPVDPAGELLVSDFLFRGESAPSGEIGHLAELSRYVFFVSRKERPGEWLNLADAATLRLPEAQPTLEDLRARKKADEERRAALPGAHPVLPPGTHEPTATPPSDAPPPSEAPPPPSPSHPR
jgi:hypothetical protein